MFTELHTNPDLLVKSRKWMLEQGFEMANEQGIKYLLWHGCNGYVAMPAETVAALLEIHSRILFPHIVNHQRRHTEMIGHVEACARMFPEDYKI